MDYKFQNVYRLDGLLKVDFSNVFIKADSKEEALHKLFAMDVADLVEEMTIEDSDTDHETATLAEAIFTVKCTNIKYDVDEDDMEAFKLSNAPTEVVVKAAYDADYITSLMDEIASEIENVAGWTVESFKAEAIDCSDEMKQDFKEILERQG